jgi:hypothetical protein
MDRICDHVLRSGRVVVVDDGGADAGVGEVGGGVEVAGAGDDLTGRDAGGRGGR